MKKSKQQYEELEELDLEEAVEEELEELEFEEYEEDKFEELLDKEESEVVEEEVTPPKDWKEIEYYAIRVVMATGKIQEWDYIGPVWKWNDKTAKDEVDKRHLLDKFNEKWYVQKLLKSEYSQTKHRYLTYYEQQDRVQQKYFEVAQEHNPNWEKAIKGYSDTEKDRAVVEPPKPKPPSSKGGVFGRDPNKPTRNDEIIKFIKENNKGVTIEQIEKHIQKAFAGQKFTTSCKNCMYLVKNKLSKQSKDLVLSKGKYTIA